QPSFSDTQFPKSVKPYRNAWRGLRVRGNVEHHVLVLHALMRCTPPLNTSYII
ncbi:hypothetical protein RSAG8_01490, partial [Rhizoctonia solani AG-8 WAC10335]